MVQKIFWQMCRQISESISLRHSAETKSRLNWIISVSLELPTHWVFHAHKQIFRAWLTAKACQTARYFSTVSNGALNWRPPHSTKCSQYLPLACQCKHCILFLHIFWYTDCSSFHTTASKPFSFSENIKVKKWLKTIENLLFFFYSQRTTTTEFTKTLFFGNF